MLIDFSTLIDMTSSEEAFMQVFHTAFAKQGHPLLDGHRTILTACYRNPGLSPSPKKIKGKDPESLAIAWLKKYNEAYENRISQRISNPPGTVADPIIDVIIQTRLPQLSIENLEQIKYAHRLSMSAENILGLLLEEFLAMTLAEYGWHCCWGEVVRHVDFCHIDGALLQVKNRSNTENSASSSVRINQPIEKWYRVDANKGAYRWSYFYQKYHTDRFSEENFIAFIQQILGKNQEALAVEADNPWQNVSNT